MTFVREAIESGKTAGNGPFTQKCQAFFQQHYGFRSVLMTHSCTAALEMAAILLQIGPDDEVIMPSYTFVSTANAFVLRGAKVVFADVEALRPNIDAHSIKQLITPRTKAIVVVHYAGIACNMDAIMQLAAAHNLLVVEDAAQAIDARYNNRPLGSFGHLAAFSFHETKNIACGEGGMLVVNDEKLAERATVIWEKGTNRQAFLKGQVDKYSWVDVGSSFLMSELSAALLWSQLIHLSEIQAQRQLIWAAYRDALTESTIELPNLPDYATHNAHIFYVVAAHSAEREQWTAQLKAADIPAYFHYIPLHSSPYFIAQYKGADLSRTDRFAAGLLRLPMHTDMNVEAVQSVVQLLKAQSKANVDIAC
jgi:dTDP-4-amino-4,6-dideoxygalactose transaminase